MSGRIHVSQLADHGGDKVSDVVGGGQMVDGKITDIDLENKKVTLSMRGLAEQDARVEGEDEVVASADGESVEVAPEMQTEE